MGKIISFEGLPGVGKTTAINKLVSILMQKGIKVATIDELDMVNGEKSKLAQLTTELLVNSEKSYGRHISPYMDTFYAQAVYYIICAEVISENIDKYDLIIMDRGIDTYFSYSMAGFKQINEVDFSDSYNYLKTLSDVYCIEPQRTYWLKDNFDNCLEKSIKRKSSVIQVEDKAFLELVDLAYMYIYEKCKKRIVKIDVEKKSISIVDEIIQDVFFTDMFDNVERKE